MAAAQSGLANTPSRRVLFSMPGIRIRIGRSSLFGGLKSRIGLSLAFVLVFLLAAAQPIRADDFDDLKSAVSEAETEFSKAEKAERAAFKKIDENNAAQRTAQGDELQRLKTTAVELKAAWRSTENSLIKARRSLATKRGELRKEASKVAEEQISAQGDVNSRAKRAGDAVDVWKEALGELLAPPEIRKCEGLDDDEAKAQKQDDKKRLNDFVSWASTEKSNVEIEFKRAEALVKGEDKFKGADAQARLINDAKSLKGTLDSRNRELSSAVKTAQERLRSLEK